MKNLWLNLNQNRYFLISDNIILPDGSFLIQSLSGKQHTTNENKLKHFEVTEETAKNHFKAELEQAVTQTKQLLEMLLTTSKSKSKNRKKKKRLEQELDTFLLGLGVLLESTTSAFSDDIEQQEVIRTHMQTLQTHLQTVGLEANTPFIDLPDELHHWLQSFQEEQTFKEIGANFVALTNPDTDPTASLGAQIDAAINKLENTFGRFFTESEAEFRKKRQKSVQKAAEFDIAKALQARGITPATSTQDTDSEPNL